MYSHATMSPYYFSCVMTAMVKRSTNPDICAVCRDDNPGIAISYVHTAAVAVVAFCTSANAAGHLPVVIEFCLSIDAASARGQTETEMGKIPFPPSWSRRNISPIFPSRHIILPGPSRNFMAAAAPRTSTSRRHLAPEGDIHR